MTATTETSPRTTSRWLAPVDLALIAAFAALISACAYIGAIPVGGRASRSPSKPSG